MTKKIKPLAAFANTEKPAAAKPASYKSKGEVKMFTIKMDAEIYKQLRLRAFQNEVTMKSIVQTAIINELGLN